MTTKTDRTQQLITGILNDRQFINSTYDSANDTLKSYIQQFFNKENTNGVMSVSDLRRNITSDDVRMWQIILNKYENNLNSDDDGSRQLQKAKQTAGTDKQALLSAICAIVIASASVGIANYLGNSLKNEYQYAMNFQEREAKTAGHSATNNYTNSQIENQAQNLLDKKNYGLTVNQRVWLRNNNLTSNTNNAIEKGIMHGMDQNYIDGHLFHNFGNSKDSISTLFDKTKGFYKNQLINQEKTRFGTVASTDVYDRYDVKLLDWNLASTHTKVDECDQLAINGPYSRDDYPSRPHWGCICFSSPHY